jgi:hypothetical protein
MFQLNSTEFVAQGQTERELMTREKTWEKSQDFTDESKRANSETHHLKIQITDCINIIDDWLYQMWKLISISNLQIKKNMNTKTDPIK